jgi:hypothetical protein
MVVNTSHDCHHALMVAVVRDVVESAQIQLIVDTVPEVVRRFVGVSRHHV